MSRVPAVRKRVSDATHADCTQGGRTLDSASTIAVGAAAIAVQLSQRSDASDQVVDASGVALAAASDVDAGAVEQLRACAARYLVVAGVLNARNAVEAALVRVRERFDDPAHKSALSSVPIRTGSTSRPTTTATRTTLGAPFTLSVETAKDYVALCEEKRRQAETRTRAASRTRPTPMRSVPTSSI